MCKSIVVIIDWGFLIVAIDRMHGFDTSLSKGGMNKWLNLYIYLCVCRIQSAKNLGICLIEKTLKLVTVIFPTFSVPSGLMDWSSCVFIFYIYYIYYI